ncbi:MAG: FkbM family methyltransferase [Synechococcales cyanobacterium RM1_1_8]|nr:FkbM family methyltransferase [Synechococcales cyanobacterium RM1_1_8]
MDALTSPAPQGDSEIELLTDRLGLLQALSFKGYRGLFKLLSRLGLPMDKRRYPVHIKGLQHPVQCRFQTSDDWVLSQIFIDGEYEQLGNVEAPQLILDCGANVGYSAVYFLNKYPQAQVIAVEPDEDNAALCRRNLAPYGDRARVIQSAIWSHSTGLVFEQADSRCGEWGISVRPVKPGERPALIATDIATVLAESGCDRIDILKVDIETAEAEVFSHNYRPWLDRVGHLAIEIHQVPGDVCAQAVYQALGHYDCDIWEAGELTFAKLKPGHAPTAPPALAAIPLTEAR